MLEDEAGNPKFWQGVIHDITERKVAEERLAASEQRFRSAFEDAGIGMAISSPGGRYLRVNRAFCGMVGYTEDELLGMTFRDITHPDDLREDLRLGRGVLAGEDRSFSMEKRYVRKDGSEIWVHLTVSMLRGHSGEPLYSIAQAQDITGRKRTEERLERHALHDALTGLPNRKHFVDRLRHALERTRRREGRKVAVLFMDLDGFKVLNDSLGHEAGDLLLTVVGQRLRRSLRPEDVLARFGGDEFVVLIEDVDAPEDAVRVAERITEDLGRPFTLEGRSLFASASIGIGMGNARTKSPEDLLRDADTAMYRAKEEQRPLSVFDPAMHKRAKNRLEIENDLRRAVDAKEFVLYYQPMVDLQTDEVWGSGGAGKVGAPRARPARPFGVRAGGRGERSRDRLRRSRSCRGLPPGNGVARRPPDPTIGGLRELVCPAAQSPGLGCDRRECAARDRFRRPSPKPRCHRDRLHSGSGGRVRRSRPPEGFGRRALHRRLRDWLLLALVPQALARRAPSR